LLAATDLEDDGYPVLSRAAELGNYLHASVLAFHQVGVAQGERSDAGDARRSVWAALQKERLEMAADRLLYDGEVFVAEGEDPAVAIVAHARELQADTIVVGTRPRRTGSPRTNTAARVVERTDRSVVIVPLDDPS
jgi:nucleotide-binding universal stress UspA family protein